MRPVRDGGMGKFNVDHLEVRKWEDERNRCVFAKAN